MILGDDYAGHRCWWRDDWEENPALINVWTSWDFALLRAYQIIEDYTDKETGQLVWVDQSPEVDWDIRHSYSGSREAELRYMKDKELKPGENIYAVPSIRNPEDPPSMLKWLTDLENDQARPMPANAPQGARPPTPEELARMRSGITPVD